MAKLDLSNEVLAEPFDSITVRFMRSDAQLFTEIFGDLSDENSEQLRARKAAANFVAATTAGIAKRALKHAEDPQSDIVPIIESALTVAAFQNYQRHRNTYEQIRDDILMPAIQCEIDIRRPGLQLRFAELTARQARLQERVKNAGNPALLMLLETAAYIAEGVDESAKLAAGIPVTPTVSDEELAELIKSSRKQLTMMGASDEEAEQAVAEELGATPEEQRAKLSAYALTQLAAHTEGTKIGAIISGEFEADLAAAAFDQLETLLSA